MQSCLRYCLLFVAVLFFPVAHATQFDKIIIFGDSLSDNGNVYALTQRASHIIPHFVPMPKSPPYYKGRFSNGVVWIEYLSQLLNVPLYDYAFGGSWAEPYYDSRSIIPFGLATQVYMYLSDNPNDASRDKHLFVIWSGGNDYSKGRNDVEYATSNTVVSIRKQMELLISMGAKHFLVLTLPDLSLAPGIVKQGTKLSKNVSQLSRLHNQKLIGMIRLERKTFPNVDFYLFNIANHMNTIRKYPEKYHIKNIKDACYNGGYTIYDFERMNGQVFTALQQAQMDIENNLSLQTVFLNSISSDNAIECRNPDEYLFWDAMHPTRKMHQLIAVATYNMLNKM